MLCLSIFVNEMKSFSNENFFCWLQLQVWYRLRILILVVVVAAQEEEERGGSFCNSKITAVS